MKFIVGKKLEMSQQFNGNGIVVPVTLVQVDPCTVTQVKTDERDGYVAVQVGYGQRKNVNKPEAGHTEQLGTFSGLHEFRVGEVSHQRGDKVDVTIFQPGDHVDVVGCSKGRGFAGVVKRHHFAGSPASHGHKDQLRMPGSIGSRRQGPVQKGKRMGGHLGDARITVKNLEIVAVEPERGLLAIKGAVPGARGSVVFIQSRETDTLWQK
ncbi:MAG TPA: 50S ribosomal protein L3 [Patescibacteria group bacterium]|nr:50S ribosomal protein L3 [Patescibacteria group bacterium]